jgi:hypothetical protein
MKSVVRTHYQPRMIEITDLGHKQAWKARSYRNQNEIFGLACFLPNHFFRILVFPNSEEDRLSQPLIPGPFSEFDLADHDRFNPNAPLHFGNG